MGPMGVVEFGITKPHLHIGHAHMVGRAVNQPAKLGLNRHHIGVTDRVAQEIGWQLLVVSLLAE